jgi:hypothetical protein
LNPPEDRLHSLVGYFVQVSFRGRKLVYQTSYKILPEQNM